MTRIRSVAVGVLTLAVMGLTAACMPPTPGGRSVTFKANSVTVNDSQDETCVLGICANRSDEPYVFNIAFRVKIGVPNSAQAYLVGDRSNAVNSLGAGQSATLTGNQQAAVNFGGITGLDVADLLNPENHLEVVGVYTWANEQDTVPIGQAATGTAAVLKDALNSTLATADLSNFDASAIVNLIFDNLGSAFGIVSGNIPLFGLGDDNLGGAIYVGIGAQGTLGDLINSVASSFVIPNINIPIVDLPPDINGGGLFTLNGNKTFTQSFSGSGGRHTYQFSATPA
jgi:hypothetical protein